jgi:ATP-dependent helicase YprA (DUF1998 family)
MVLTRPEERQRLVRAAKGLQFLVLDELHTYRGRQGADVAFLVRRVRDSCEAERLQCIGTSATMASGGSSSDQKQVVADVATRLFGDEVTPDRVIGETLIRATEETEPLAADLAAAVREEGRPRSYGELATGPLSRWVESTFGVVAEAQTGRLVRRVPTRLPDAAKLLADDTGESEQRCADAIQDTLLAGARARKADTGRPLFAFRLHQFLSKATPSTSAWSPRTSDTSPTSTRSPSPTPRTSRCSRWRSAGSAARSTSSSPAPRRPAHLVHPAT